MQRGLFKKVRLSSRGIWQEKVESKTSHRFSPRGLIQRLFPPTTPPRLTLFFFAIAVQCLAAIFAGIFMGFESARNIGVALCSVVFFLALFVIIFAMAKPALERRLEPWRQKLLTGAKVIVVVLVIAIIGEAIIIAPLLSGSEEALLFGRWQNPFTTNDRIALTYQGSQTLLDGENPYTHSNIILAMEQFPTVDPTPLRQGDFAEVYPYPTEDQIEEALAKARANPEVPPLEFESKITYPAGSFLFQVPFVALGLDLRWFYLLCTLIMMGVIAWQAPPSLRPLAITGAIVGIIVWTAILGGTMDPLYILFLLLGWTLRRRPWASAIFIGLAAISKQTAWMFIPFYLVLLLHESGWRRSLQSAAVIGGVFVAANIAFIVDDPQAWFAAVFAPILDPLFPQGAGIVSFAALSTSPSSPLLYSLLMGAVLTGALAWYYLRCRQAPQTALLLAMVPVFFSWRSLASYFSLLPLLVFGAVIILEYKRARAAASEPAPS